MKKILLSLVVPLVFMTTLSAQISQEQADEIVIERLSNETKPYCIYAQKEVQTEFEITTATGEILELDYMAWVYYVGYTGGTNGKYLIVKESNGNLLEVNTKNDADPDGLVEWRFVPIEIPFEEYSLSKTMCVLTNLTHPFDFELILINNNEELEQYIVCAEENYPEIDFSKHTLLLANGIVFSDLGHTEIVGNINKNLQQLSVNGYKLNVEIELAGHTVTSVVECWHFAIIINKLSAESTVELNVANKEASCLFKNLTYNNSLLVINSNEELENYVECTDNNDFPEIDFSSHTLLLATGFTTSCPGNINTQLTKISENAYTFDVDVTITITGHPDGWIAKTLIAKLPPEAIVTLNVNIQYY